MTDWNHDGKITSTDHTIDYEVYKRVWENEDPYPSSGSWTVLFWIAVAVILFFRLAILLGYA